MKQTIISGIIFLLFGIWGILFSQTADSVDVTFFYSPSGNPSAVYLPGEFNGWTLSNSTKMTLDAGSGVWSKTVRLRVGGPNPLPAPGKSIPGAYQYKFNENNSTWLADPLNPRQNPLDNGNSYLYIKDPTIHYLLPNSRSGLITTSQPEVSAYIFPALTSTVDASTIHVMIDSTVYTDLGPGYDPVSKKLSFVPTEPLSNGNHKLKLYVESSSGVSNTDSTTFIVQAGFIQFLTRANDHCLRATKTIAGTVGESGLEVKVRHLGVDSLTVTADGSGNFSASFDLLEGLNEFQAVTIDSNGHEQMTDILEINYVVNHSPKPQIGMSMEMDKLILKVTGNDPDGDQLTYSWTSDDERNPEPLHLISSADSFSITPPVTPGEYFVSVTATDPDLNQGSSRSYFWVNSDSSVTVSGINNNPEWVKNAVVYEIYLPAFTPEGTFAAATQRLANIKLLGANVIWLMPIFDNGETINDMNAGYNIIDFYKVHPQLGSLDDFRAFLAEAHRLGMHVVLDITPNHVSASHPWVKDVELFHNYSNDRPMLETQILGDDRGLGQFATKVGDYTLYTHYSNWALANINYNNIEARDYMLNMFEHWIVDEGVDGYRMDVYWGPQNRYGKSVWWRPFREEVKRAQSDILIIGETDGTGAGSENNYADGGGACDAAYDWSLYGQMKTTLSGGSLSDLDNRVRNYSPTIDYNYYTGINSHYLRFLENHDETRITQSYGLDRAKAGAALLYTIPGVPLVYAGQEVGETSQRGKINWDRNGASETFAYFQRLLAIRNNYATFSSSEIKKIATTSSRVYAYLRPEQDQNAIAAVNFSSGAVTTSLSIIAADLKLSTPLEDGVEYYLNDLLNDTTYTVTNTDIQNFQINLPAWKAAVFVLADSVIKLVTPVAQPEPVNLPMKYYVSQNYPNPFNPETNINFELPATKRIRIDIYNVLGQKVRTLADATYQQGRYSLKWDGRNDFGDTVSSGVYILHFSAGKYRQDRRMLLLK